MRLLVLLSCAAFLLTACAGAATPSPESQRPPVSASISEPTVAMPTATRPAGTQAQPTTTPASPAGTSGVQGHSAAPGHSTPPGTPTSPAGLPTGLSAADVVARVRPAVVHIKAEDSVGSGILYRPDGYIITNHHVVADARRVTVTLSDGRALPGQVLGSLPDFDLAVLKVDATELPFAFFGDISSLREGEDVIAIGYALDFTIGGPTVTNGIVSAKRPLPGGPTLIQTTVPINPGNSGGPLLNRLGQVVGINALRLHRVGYTPVQGVSFAISAADALTFASGGRAPEQAAVTAIGAPTGQVPSAQEPARQVAAPPAQAATPIPPTPVPPLLTGQPAARSGEPALTPTPLPAALAPAAPARAVSVAIGGYDLIPPSQPGSGAYLVGEVWNAGPDPIENAQVTVAFLDEAGRVVGTKSAASDLSVIHSQERAPFSVQILRTSPQWAGVQAQVSAVPASPAAIARSHRDLVTESVSFNQPSPGANGYSLAGAVRNTGTTPARSVKVAAVLYNANGHVIDAVSAPADLPVLQPGQASPFRLNLHRSGNSGNYARYILVAEGAR